MKYALGNMLNGAGGLNADQLALDLPFAVTKSLTAAKGPTPTFTRASGGTFVGSNGLIQTAATNVARFDHDPVTLASRGLLIEESRTNLILQSEDINTAAWGSINGTVSNNYGTSPDGTINADKFVEDSSLTAKYFRQVTAITIANATVYTFSVYAKPDGRNFCSLQGDTSSGFLGTVSFDLLNGTVGSATAGATGTIQNVGNGWYRLSMTSTSTGTSARPGFLLRTNSSSTLTQTYQGDGVSGLLFWGAQLEAGSFATSYIPTTTSSVVRSADVCSISGAGFTGMWNALEGSLFTSAIFNAPVAYGAGQLLVDVNDGTAANRLRYFRNVSSGTAGFANTSGNSLNVVINGTTALQPFASQKHSVGFKLDDYVFYVNNSQIGTDNLGAMIVSPTTLTIGDASAGATRQYTNGTISAIRYYRKRLPNAKLQALTV